MQPGQDVLIVVQYTALAAVLSAVGALPFAFRRDLSVKWIAVAYSLASGLMLGAAYLLLNEGLTRGLGESVTGFLSAIGYTALVHTYSGTIGLDTKPETRDNPEKGYKIILQSTLHSASEGVAIGTAMALNLKFGIFLVIAMAFHNIGESTALTSELRSRGVSVGEAAGLSIVTNLPQVILGVFAFSVASALGSGLDFILGFSAGAMAYLTLTELLPASYQRSGSRMVALIISFSAGTVVLLRTLLL